MGKEFDKFRLLMWKNFLLQWRHPLQTLIEIMIPVLLCSILVIKRTSPSPVAHSAKFYKPFENKIAVLHSPVLQHQVLKLIVWSPYNPILEQIMNKTVSIIAEEEHWQLGLLAFNDSKTMNRNLTSNMHQMLMVLCGVQFDDDLAGDTELNPHVNITIRFPSELRAGEIHKDKAFGQYTWKTNLLFPIYQIAGPRGWNMNEGAEPSYSFEGFLKLQQELSYSIIEHFAVTKNFNRKSVPIYMQRFPYPNWIQDSLLTSLKRHFGFLIVLSLGYTCMCTTKFITKEKQMQLKETMKTMGLSKWLHWMAWFLKSFCIMLVATVIIQIILTVKLYPKDYIVFSNSNPLVIFIFLIFYICASITFCFAVSVSFSRGNTASIMAGALWFLSYIPYSYTEYKYDGISLLEKLFLSLFCNSAMAYGFQLIVMFEGIGEGVQWHNIWKTTTPDNGLVLGHVMTMLTIDTIIHILITLYLEAVLPGHGVTQAWYFPCTKLFGRSRHTRVGNASSEASSLANEFYEEEPTHLPIGVKIEHLQKKFPHNNVVVRDLSLNMYQDQITVIVGHNSSGKTAVVSMLTGMVTPTSGTAIIGGCNIKTDMKTIRENLGLCPQLNVLFKDLTVKEHLYFYCHLKGFRDKDLKVEITKYLQLLQLTPKKNALACRLSGSMKRKLSVAIALCGGSSVVILDEPTAGMDPAARRVIWSLLQSQKKGRTILLTTHFMDEADLLGDRIAIMAGGTLQCCGSSNFLKRKYGAGYHLIIDKSKQCDVSQITKLLTKYIPDIQVERNVESELSYLLSEEQSSDFESMFNDLERNGSALGVKNHGISLTTLAEVFTVVGVNRNQEECTNPIMSMQRMRDYQRRISINIAASSTRINNLKRPIEADQVSTDKDNTKLTNWVLWKNQVRAMLKKRFLCFLRGWFLLLVHIRIPAMFIIFAVAIVRSSVTHKYLPNLKIQLDTYDKPITVLTHNENNVYAERYIEILKNDTQLFQDWKDDNLSSLIFEETVNHVSVVRLRYICGATFFKNNSIKAWFNNEPYHSPSLTLQLAMNAILQQEASPSHRIQIYNNPIPYTLNRKFSEITRLYNTEFQIAFNIGFGMAFVSSFYMIYYILERKSKSKHLQFISGVGVIAFWFSSFLCDMITFILTCLCIIATLVLIEEEGFITARELLRVFSVLLCFGLAILPMMYLASFLFNSPSIAYKIVTLINLFTGVAGFLIVQVLSAPELKLQDVVNTLHWVFLIIPHYSLSSGIRDLYLVYSIHHDCDAMFERCVSSTPSVRDCKLMLCEFYKQCCATTRNYYSLKPPGIGRNIIFLCFLSIFFTLILLLIEYGVFKKLHFNMKWYTSSAGVSSNTNEDIEVKKENQKVRNATMDEIKTYAFVMRDVTKYYGKFVAVNKICLAAKKFECIGLLGLNGSGKTTIFKMMTGDIKMSSGNAWVKGISVKTNINKARQLFGYCPEADALLSDLTCRETLVIFSLLQGVQKSETRATAENLASQFDFYQYLDKKVRLLNNNTKRKLNVAISLIGDPPVLYLDDPTSGMDPASKRYLWNTLCKVRDKGTCIILTSHSMEECEALCTRMAIMVNGTFVCLGSTELLKSKYSWGYLLIIKVRRTKDGEITISDLQKIETFVKINFDSAEIHEKYEQSITFYIPDKSLPWSNMFGIMERGKQSLNIEDYSIGQSSLEQVFLTSTKRELD